MRTAVFCLALVLAAACRENADVSQDAPSQSSTTTDATPTSTVNPAIPQEADNPAARPASALPTQEVHLIEYAIHMPDTLSAGRIAFNVENGGKEKHAFEIEGNGVHAETNELPAGNTAALEVDLKPGTYTIYCPVEGHRGKGMEKTVTVR